VEGFGRSLCESPSTMDSIQKFPDSEYNLFRFSTLMNPVLAAQPAVFV
jgi:hypothetical protein